MDNPAASQRTAPNIIAVPPKSILSSLPPLAKWP